MVGSGGIVLPGCPPGSEIHIWRAGIADDRATLVIDKAGNTPFHNSNEN